MGKTSCGNAGMASLSLLYVIQSLLVLMRRSQIAFAEPGYFLASISPITSSSGIRTGIRCAIMRHGMGVKSGRLANERNEASPRPFPRP